ncbi:MAG: GvpL/GvpF family gas vesicle protein [Candidatus Methylumidiphilus sp.]
MNAIKSNSARAKILYALCAADDEAPAIKVRGLETAPVYAIDSEGLRAIVSDTLSPRVRPERRNITAHQSVLHTLMESTTVLPMRFGVIARNADAVRKLLAANRKSIKEHIEKLNGRVEMGLRVSWDTSNIYEYFVATHPVLREARDEVYGKSSNVKRDDKVELGRLYESLRAADRKDCTEKVKEILIDYCEDIIENPVKKEKDIMNLACLVERDHIDDFAKGIFQASKFFDNVYLFDYTGPWAPHNFVTLDLRAPTAKAAKADADADADEEAEENESAD